MPSTPRSKSTVYLEIDPQLKADFKAFAAGRGTTFTAEAEQAFRRHLAFPAPLPVLAPLPDAAPPRQRGRPRKESRNNS